MIAYNQPITLPGANRINTFAANRMRALFMLVFFIPFSKWEPFGSLYFTLPFLASYFYFAFCLASMSLSFNIKKVSSAAFPFLLLIGLMWIMTTLNYSPKSTMAYSEIRRLTLSFLFFVALSNEIRIRPALENQLLIAFMMGLYLVAVLFVLGIGVGARGARLEILGLNPNAMALLFVLGLFATLKVLLEVNFASVTRYIIIFFAALFLLIVVRSGSRSAIVGLAIGPAVYLYFYKLPLKRKIPFVVIGGVILVLILGLVLSSDIIQQRFQEQTEDENWGGRIPIWEATLPLVYEHPWFGAGASGYETHFLKYFGQFHAVHNVYLQILAYTGIVGLSVFFWLLARLGRGAFIVNRYKGTPFYLAVWFTYLVYYFAGGGVIATFVLWFLMGLINGQVALMKEQLKIKQ